MARLLSYTKNFMKNFDPTVIEQKMDKFLEKTKKYEHLQLIPIFGGTCYGCISFGYAGYKMSNNKDITENVMSTTGGLIVGSVCGFILGVFWPITSMVVLGRISEDIYYKYKDPDEEKVSRLMKTMSRVSKEDAIDALRKNKNSYDKAKIYLIDKIPW